MKGSPDIFILPHGIQKTDHDRAENLPRKAQENLNRLFVKHQGQQIQGTGKMSYHPKHFALNEIIPANIIAERGEQAWSLMDDRILMAADWLREKFGPAVVNGKFRGKVFRESGLRDPFTKTGAKWSQHKFGRALDLKFTQVTVREVYDYIMANQAEARANGITCVENIDFTPTWLHIDSRKLPDGFPKDKVLVVNP